MEVPAIGIDLGTVNSCVAVYRNDRVDIIQNYDDRITPSFVFFKENGDVEVGTTALDICGEKPSNGVFDTKRFIGRSFNDPAIQEIYQNYPFRMSEGENHRILLEIDVDGNKIQKHPEHVSAEILRSLKNSASDYLGFPVTDAVITIPAYFNNSQRQSTKTAAELAGLNVLKLINEPTAAAVNYLAQHEQDDNMKVIIFDLGGGTLDVSIVNIQEKKIQVECVDGDTFLGGRNFDEVLANHFIEEAKTKLKTLTSQQIFQIRNETEHIKKKLSVHKEYKKVLPHFNNGKEYTLATSREEFENMCAPIVEKCMKVVERCLNDAQIEKTEIQKVILVGGSTRIPKIQEKLKNFFNIKELTKDINPEECVASGAAIQAAICKRCYPKKLNLIDVTPLSLGVMTEGKIMSFLIRRNTAVPVTVKKTFVTTENDQERCIFPLYEGERRNATYNNALGIIEISNLPKGRAEHIKMEVTFHLNENGILEVTGKETSQGKEEKLIVVLDLFNVRGDKIRPLTVDLKSADAEDDVLENFANIKYALVRLCHKYVYGKDHNDSFVKNCNKFANNISKLEFDKKETLKKHLEEFRKEVPNPTMMRFLEKISSKIIF